MTPSRPLDRGFSLVELMIALVILSVGVLVIAQLFPLSSRNLIRDRLRTGAVYFAQQKVETLRTMQAGTPDLGIGRHPLGTATENLGGSLQRYWTVTQLPAPLENVMRIDVVVSWNDPTGVDSVVSTSYVNH